MMKRLFLISLLLAVISCARPSSRYLILNADDAGMASDVNRAIISDIENGFITSVSIMVPAPAFEEIAAYARTHPEISWGIHLTLNSEWKNYRWGPVLGKTSVPSLVDPEGYFWDSTRELAIRANLDEVERELRAQIELAIANGITPSHFDTHMYALFTRDDLRELYLKLGIEYQVPVLFFKKSELMTNWSKVELENWQKSITTLEQAKQPILNYYNGHNYFTPTDERKSYVISLIKNLPIGVSLIALHPAEASEWFKTVTNSALNREIDQVIAKDPEVLNEIKKGDVELISWKEFLRNSKKVN